MDVVVDVVAVVSSKGGVGVTIVFEKAGNKRQLKLVCRTKVLENDTNEWSH